VTLPLIVAASANVVVPVSAIVIAGEESAPCISKLFPVPVEDFIIRSAIVFLY
jgi:hypothetical protein